MSDKPDTPTPAFMSALSAGRLAVLQEDEVFSQLPAPPPAWKKIIGKGTKENPVQLSQADTIEILRYTLAQENHICRALVADALRRALAYLLDRNGDKVPPDVLADLRRWAARATPEALADWLNRVGWEKMDKATGDAVETALLAACGGKPFSKTGTKKTNRDGLQTAPPFVFLYDTPRAARTAPETLARIEKEMPADATPEKITVLLGLDALRAAWRQFDWFLLASLLPESLDDRAGDWLGRLAAPWMDEESAYLDERRDREAHALPLALQSRNLITAPSTKAAFVRFPSILKDAGAWSGAMVEVDGNTIFAEEPQLAAAPVRVLDAPDGKLQLYKPRAWTVAAERRLKGPRQMALPGLLTNPPLNPDLEAYLAVTATGAAVLDRLPGLCVKLLPLLFALCPLDGTAVAGPVRDLVKLLYPNWRDRRQMAGDVARVGAAVTALLGLRIVEAVPGKGLRFYPVLHCDRFDAPTKANDIPEACLRMNPGLAELATPAKGKGDFLLLNLSRLMELDATRADRVAVALRLAAYWHTCKQRLANGRRVFMPERLDFIPVDNLLVEINAPGPVADVIAGADLGRAGKVKLSEARRRLVDETLPALVDAGLLGAFDVRRPDRYAGRGADAWQVKIPPPADYLEATRKTASTRPPPKEGRRRGRTTRKGG
jgi:hypothetical protein